MIEPLRSACVLGVALVAGCSSASFDVGTAAQNATADTGAVDTAVVDSAGAEVRDDVGAGGDARADAPVDCSKPTPEACAWDGKTSLRLWPSAIGDPVDEVLSKANSLVLEQTVVRKGRLDGLEIPLQPSTPGCGGDLVLTISVETCAGTFVEVGRVARPATEMRSTDGNVFLATPPLPFLKAKTRYRFELTTSSECTFQAFRPPPGVPAVDSEIDPAVDQKWWVRKGGSLVAKSGFLVLSPWTSACS